MRIAISGTHSLGKSTFVNDFHQKHSDYILETEPFRALRDNHIIHFAEKATQLCNLLQIDHCIERSKLYHKNDNVIFDRCAADYLPYSEYPEKFGDTDIDKLFIDSLYPLINKAMNYLDLIVFIPISESYCIDIEDDGIRPTDAFYQEWVDQSFKRMYREKWQSIVGATHKDRPKIVEITGDRQHRVKTLEDVIQSMDAK